MVKLPRIIRPGGRITPLSRAWWAMRCGKRRRQGSTMAAPTITGEGPDSGSASWRATAAVAVDAWQICCNDAAYLGGDFDTWVAGADDPSAAYSAIDPMNATLSSFFRYCAARYQVGGEWSAWSAVADREALPAAPTGFSATANVDRIGLGWTNVATTAAGVRIYRSFDSGPFEVLTELDAGANNYEDTDVATTYTYGYYVVAFNALGVSMPSNVDFAVGP